MSINIASFSANSLGKICIARIMPRGLDLPHLKVLAPSRELLHAYKRGTIDWDGYSRVYWEEIAGRCKSSPAVWSGGRGLPADGEAQDMRQACLVFLLTSAAKRLGVEEISLCCHERPEDEHCHRKIIFDVLPPQIQGPRL